MSRICLAIKTILPYFIILLWINLILPSLKIQSALYQNLYYQTNYYTKHFDFAKLFLFISSYLFGLFYINKLKPNQSLISRKKISVRYLAIVFFISIFLFFTSGISVLHGKYDYEEFCDEPGEKEINLHRSKKIIIFII
jgi:hypothetical protein